MTKKKSTGQTQAEAKLINVTWVKKRPPYNVGECCGLPVEAARKAVEVDKLAKYTSPREAKSVVAAEEKRERVKLLAERKKDEEVENDSNEDE